MSSQYFSYHVPLHALNSSMFIPHFRILMYGFSFFNYPSCSSLLLCRMHPLLRVLCIHDLHLLSLMMPSGHLRFYALSALKYSENEIHLRQLDFKRKLSCKTCRWHNKKQNLTYLYTRETILEVTTFGWSTSTSIIYPAKKDRTA